MTKEEAKALFDKASDNAINYKDDTEVISISSAFIIINKIYDELDAKHKYIIELIAHTAGSGNKAISQTLLTIDGILKEMREQK